MVSKSSSGNAVSNTYTLNFSYGIGLVAEGTGVLLNNEMDDFSAKPGVPNAFGLESSKGVTTAGISPDKLINATSTTSSDGAGSVQRNETVTTSVAAIVTQVLPNGNLVVEGKQEIRINFEVRELIVAGVVRPEDIESDNTIDSSKIAQARIAYGGRGQITDVQQPRYGQQIVDILLPF